MSTSHDHLVWSRLTQLLKLIAKGHTLRVSIRISLAVGTILTVSNQGSLIVGGSFSAGMLVRVAINYLVPFFVSSIAYLAPFRVKPIQQP